MLVISGEDRADPAPAAADADPAEQEPRRGQTVGRDKTHHKPLCLMLQFAPSLFPDGDFDRLSELDRQRLVTFLNWINDPFFSKSGNFIVLVSDTKAEMNRRILAPPVTEHVEIPLPNTLERAHFVTQYIQAGAPPSLTLQFEPSQQTFIEDTAGLKLTSLEDLLETSRRTWRCSQAAARHAEVT